MKQKKVLITGGSGLIGMELIKLLLSKDYQVSVLGRSKLSIPGINSFIWQPTKAEIERDALQNVNYVIHLAGENVAAKPWSGARKKAILDSRVLSTNLLFKTIHELKIKPEAFISASAIGFYGAVTSKQIFTEEDSAANDFLGSTCLKWEQSVDQFNNIGVRTVKFRTGLVLSKSGGALAKMALPLKFGLGSAIGSGQQYMPWIHIDDLCAMYLAAIENEQMHGVYNAIAPEHVTNAEFTKVLADLMHKPLWLPNVPSLLMKMTFGEMADILLQGSRISSAKIENLPFSFQYKSLRAALSNLLIG